MRIIAWIGGLVVGATVVSATVVTTATLHTGNSNRPAAASAVQPSGVGFGPSLPTGLFPLTPTAAPTIPAKTPRPSSPSSAPAPPRLAPPSIVVGSAQQALINQDRARYHLAPLTWSSCLFNVARYEAAHLASPGVAFQHYDGVNRDLACHLGRQVGENIGWWSAGINDAQLNTMFMNSPEHRANILGPYRYIGTAWAVRSDGRAFIAVEFG
jgi:uncharacterized protein YkwD